MILEEPQRFEALGRKPRASGDDPAAVANRSGATT